MRGSLRERLRNEWGGVCMALVILPSLVFMWLEDEWQELVLYMGSGIAAIIGVLWGILEDREERERTEREWGIRP